jgi:phosphoglycolate phosphatase
VSLLLFDIDGTLVRGATDAHRDALHMALRAVHGIEPGQVPKTLEPAGRTDGEIARAILLAAGISAITIDEHAADVRAECCRVYAELCTADLSDTVLPGIRELLSWADDEHDVRLALVTGNYEPIARIKLKAAGLIRHFPPGQGGFGSDAEDRLQLPTIARRRAGQDGIAYPRAQTIVIGDTPRDILCAKADRIRCFAVATGPYATSELTDADAVASDAGQLHELLKEAVAG